MGGRSTGDVMGCAIDLGAKTVSFSLNGSWDAPMGQAFEGIEVDRGVLPAVTAQGMQVRLNLGEKALKHEPPAGHVSVFAAMKASSE